MEGGTSSCGLQPLCCSKKRSDIFLSLELLCSGILFGLFNNLSTVFNAKTLHEAGYQLAAGLSLFFLVFPGLITSVWFLVCHWMGHKQIGRLPPFSVIGYFFILLVFYPVLPICLCIYTLLTGKRRELPIMAKLFEGFLDDGPQFVLRLVVFVLYGVGAGKERDDVIFTLSMCTSFCAIVYFGLQFNERSTNAFTKWLLCLPMFMASAAARGFTLAVFLKETSSNDVDKMEWIGGIVILCVGILLNIVTFRHCGQDWTRSIVFGLSSTLIPAGYNNDEYFYQRPNQPLWGESYAVSTSVAPAEQTSPSAFEMEAAPQATETAAANQQEEATPVKMKSGLFLILHTVCNTLLLSGCAIYISVTRDLSTTSDNALVLPQILAVIPGCFFTLARSLLLLDGMKPEACHPKAWTLLLVCSAGVLGVIAYGSVIPAAFWSLLWKATGTISDVFEDK